MFTECAVVSAVASCAGIVLTCRYPITYLLTYLSGQALKSHDVRDSVL